MFERATMLATITASAIALGACDESITTPVDDEPVIAADNVPVEGTVDVATLDRTDGDGSLFDRLAEQIPGFGGFWFDRRCNLNVVLTRPNEEAELAKEILAPFLRRYVENNRCPDTAAILIHAGEFDWNQLSGWLRQLAPAARFPGVARLGISVPLNRIVVAVEGRPAARAVLRLAEENGVPAAAIQFVLAGSTDRAREHDRTRTRG